MQWKIREFEFCEQKHELRTQHQSIKLESIASRVLEYFCKHPNRVISREELIEKVWEGQVVTDNAVNRVIARLRKAFNDDAKDSKFITTVPKKGYRFIADVTLIETETGNKNVFASTSDSPAQHSKEIRALILLAMLPILLLIAYLVIKPFLTIQHETTSYKSQALTRDQGAEIDVALSPDEKWLVYSRFEDDVLNMYLKELSTSKQYLLSDKVGNAGGATWAKDGRSLVYLYTTAEQCQYRQRAFLKGTFGPHKVVYNCPQGSFGKSVLSHDGQTLIFSQTEGSGKPYFIYQLNIQSGELTKVSQPEPYLGGHSAFDLHPRENKLLVSSPNQQQRLSFYILDLNNKQFTLLFEKGGYLCCAIWDHTGKSIVMMGPYPATQINEYDMTGNQLRVLHYASQTLGPPERVANGRDFIFSAGNFNIGLNLISADGKQRLLRSSSMQEYLPAVNEKANNVAFISDQSGQEQLWLLDIATQSAEQITSYDDHQKYFDLVWSPEGRKIALLMINGIKVIDLTTRQSDILRIPQTEIRGVSWVDGDTLALSMKNGDFWRLHHYTLYTETLQKQPYDWAFANYQGGQYTPIWFSDSGETMQGDQPFRYKLQSPLQTNRRFSFQQYKGAIFFERMVNGSRQIVKGEFNSDAPKPILENNLMFGFSVYEKGVIAAIHEASEMDVYRTLSE